MEVDTITAFCFGAAFGLAIGYIWWAIQLLRLEKQLLKLRVRTEQHDALISLYQAKLAELDALLSKFKSRSGRRKLTLVKADKPEGDQ